MWVIRFPVVKPLSLCLPSQWRCHAFSWGYILSLSCTWACLLLRVKLKKTKRLGPMCRPAHHGLQGTTQEGPLQQDHTSAKPRGLCAPSQPSHLLTWRRSHRLPTALLPSDDSHCHVYREVLSLRFAFILSPNNTAQTKTELRSKMGTELCWRRWQNCYRERISRADHIFRDSITLPCALGARTEVCPHSGHFCSLLERLHPNHLQLNHLSPLRAHQQTWESKQTCSVSFSLQVSELRRWGSMERKCH